jgi:hypothetical protein
MIEHQGYLPLGYVMALTARQGQTTTIMLEKQTTEKMEKI